MNKLPNAVKYGIFLVLLGVISGGLLALINSFTSPIIKEREEKLLNETLKSDFPSSTYEDVTNKYRSGINNTSIQNMYFAGDESGNLTTVIYKVSNKGYGGQIVSLVGIDVTTGKFIKVKVVDATNETPGIGQKVYDADFGLPNRNVNNYKFSKYGEVITRATISSNAVGSGLNDAANHYNSIKGSLANIKVGA